MKLGSGTDFIIVIGNFYERWIYWGNFIYLPFLLLLPRSVFVRKEGLNSWPRLRAKYMHRGSFCSLLGFGLELKEL